MPARRRSRQKALQVLYQCDLCKLSTEDAMRNIFDVMEPEEGEERPQRDDFTQSLVNGTTAHVVEIDERITRYSENWRLERMPTVDRNILRLAVYEMLWLKTPPAVVIDEALELARRYSGDESVGFVNGVLDAVRRGSDDSGIAPGVDTTTSE